MMTLLGSSYRYKDIKLHTLLKSSYNKARKVYDATFMMNACGLN